MMNLNVIYEDNHIIVVEKLCNVPSQKDDTGDVDMTFIVKEYLRSKYNKKGNVYLGLVHRLDRPVGGIMLFAKTSKAASRLSSCIRNNEMEKYYLAVINGKIKPKEGILKDYLLKNKKTNMVSVVIEDTIGAKEAILEYKILKEVDNLSLVMVKLITGRSHQIRVQFKNMGASLYGDQRYGVGTSQKGQQIALWSYKISFMHPVKKTLMQFSIEPKSEYIPWRFFKMTEIIRRGE